METNKTSYEELIKQTKDNEIIIDFMSDLKEWSYVRNVDGLKFYRTPWQKHISEFNDKSEIIGEFFIGDCNFFFRNDWKWLMPVIKKIDNLLYEIQNDPELQSILEKYEFVYHQNRLLISPLLEETYPFVVEFIKWYKSKY
jgi:hypothetical protein